MLTDLHKVIQRNEDIDEAILRETAAQLLARQFLLRQKPRHRRYYETVMRFQGYFSNLMDALNYQFTFDEERGFVGVTPINYVHRMSLDETLFAFALRFLYDEAICNYTSNDDGTVDISTEDFELRYLDFAKRDIPKNKGDFLELLKPFIRCSVVEFGNDENHPEIERLKILPTITALLNGDAIKRIEVYLRAEDVITPLEAEDEEE